MDAFQNPYRVRPGRPKIDSNLGGYGVQKPWVPGTVPRPPSIDTNTVFQPPPPIPNQNKSANDSWDWNVDNSSNGNDSWNWNVEQSEAQSHPQEQSLPPNQYVPTYGSQKQPGMPPSQDNFYNNFNGNNKIGVNSQHGFPGRETPKTVPPPQEPMPKQPNTFPQQTNFSHNHNQQFPIPPRPISNSSQGGSIDHPQWSKEHNQSSPYAPPNQMHNQSPQAQQPPTQTNSVNNYAWNNVEPQNVPMHNWPNHNETPASSYWQETTSSKQEQFSDNINSSWSSQTQQAPHHSQHRIHNACPPNTNNEQPKYLNFNNSLQESTSTQNWLPRGSVMSNQRSKSNHESITNFLPRQQSLPSNTWSQVEDANSMPTWHQGGASHNIPNSHWRQAKLQQGGSLEESALSENNKNEWQQIHALPSHFNSSTTSTTSGSLANMSSSTEQLEDRKKSLTPSTSCASLNEFQAQASTSNPNNIENNIGPHQGNADSDWNTEGDWNTVNELSNGVSNLQLDSLQNQHAGDASSFKEEQPNTNASNDWGKQSMPGSKSNHVGNTPDSPAVFNLEHTNREESPNVKRDHTNSQASSVKSVDKYDQWYNQNVHMQSDKDFFNSDRTHSSDPWPPAQNVENYENIQQTPDFVNLEVVAPEPQARDMYGSHDSINKETLDNDQVVRQTTPPKEASMNDFRQETNNVEVPANLQQAHLPLQSEQVPDNYEFASNDRNTFLETGELTDLHSQDHEAVPPSQDDENDEVPSDIPFAREVLGQSSSIDPRRNDPTGQEQYAQGVGSVSSVSLMGPRMSDPRRNDPSGQEQQQQQPSVSTRPGLQSDRTTDRRDVPSGQERNTPVQQLQQPPLARVGDLDNSSSSNISVERRNDPSGRERSVPPVPPQQSRNEPSGEEQRVAPQILAQPEPGAIREIPGRGNEPEDVPQQPDSSSLRQIPGGASSNESVQIVPDDRTRVVTGSQPLDASASATAAQDSSSDSRVKREEAVGASVVENQGGTGPQNRRDSYEDGDDEGSGNSREDSRDRRRDPSPKSRHSRYDYNRKSAFYDRDRDFDDDYYYDRRRGADYDRPYNSREDLDRRDGSFREDDRRLNNRDDLERERHSREDLDRRSRHKEEIDDRDGGRRRIDERRRDTPGEPRRLDREGREFDPRYPRDRDYLDRERDRRRDDRRPRRHPEYDPRDPRDPREPYRREYYEDSYGRNSRPSSRSSYNDRDRDYYMRGRDPYSSYPYNNYQGYDYGSNYNNNYYAYLENLRRTDPAAYAEWYHKYYQHQQQVSRGVAPNYPEDRASVHSGRSSCDDRNSSDKRNLTDTSLLDDQQTTMSSRLTPTKFSTAHAKGSLSVGVLLHVHPSYPADGERAKIDILKMNQLLISDVTYRELRSYPGPLIKGVTHKKMIIDYCKDKIEKAPSRDDIIEVSSYVLLYDLMKMLIEKNGKVDGEDISSLLSDNEVAYPYDANKPSKRDKRRESTVSQRSSASGGEKVVSDTVQPVEIEEQTKVQKSVKQLTDEFRDKLLRGSTDEALEFAMVEGLWGHALFLASKISERRHKSVMTRFANSLPPQDPLQTLYQLHSGQKPACVTCLSDPSWYDWRPHLAMIISNDTSANPKVNRRSIISKLGDTLLARGDLYAAHFCYVVSEVEFGSYGSDDAKIVLIGANHQKPYSEFLSMEAIMLTEIYEYGRKLNEPFTLANLQTFKFNVAAKMVDYGLIEKALLYIEQVAINLIAEPERYKSSFISDVYSLGDRLRYHDPVYRDSDEDIINLSWLKSLEQIVLRCESGEIVQESDSGAVDSNLELADNQLQQQSNLGGSHHQSQFSTSMMSSAIGSYGSKVNPWGVTPSMNNSDQLDDDARETSFPETDHEEQQPYRSYQQDYWASQQQQQQQQTYEQQDYGNQEYAQSEWSKNTSFQYTSEQQDSEQSQHQNQWGYESEKLEGKRITAAEQSSKDEVSSPARHLTNTIPDSPADSILRQRRRAPSSLSDNEPPPLATKLHKQKYPKLNAFALKPPPVFLKCTPKSKSASEDFISKTTDLDIQFGKMRVVNESPHETSVEKEKVKGQTLTQYCNFDEKKVVKVAPHVRRKDVICDTVDAWSRQQSLSSPGKYRPLIFGGTFPIDAPLTNRPKPEPLPASQIDSDDL
ncbi:hypothetical protein QAD02_015794 [Eretmocerus hayati]|uniref:Uncharacterized protein n=1 Tax=Eretmocerus hayati TaxID=131215 RepID=A0ACC2PC36_9HYME|nr:hypothetical protein QAD02_015794 [Eretmocerus hayati]